MDCYVLSHSLTAQIAYNYSNNLSIDLEDE